MTNIAFLFTGGRKNRVAATHTGESPADFFYGALELRRRGYAVELLEYADLGFTSSEPKTFGAKLVKKIKAKAGMQPTFAKAVRTKESLARLHEFDLLITTTNGIGLELGSLVREKLLKAKVLCIGMGIIEPSASPAQKQQVADSLSVIQTALISKNELEFLRKEFPQLDSRLVYLPFGIDYKFWVPASPDASQGGPSYVFSIGNDAHRDYETLVKAWKPEYPQLKIITKMKVSMPRETKNITVHVGDWRGQLFSDIEIRTFMQQSLFGIIPVRETIQPSGQSACLQMMACSKAVILSKMAGLWDEDAMKHRVSVLLPAPGSVSGLQEQVEFLLKNPNQQTSIGVSAREVVAKNFTIEIMADELEKIIADYVATR